CGGPSVSGPSGGRPRPPRDRRRVAAGRDHRLTPGLEEGEQILDLVADRLKDAAFLEVGDDVDPLAQVPSLRRDGVPVEQPAAAAAPRPRISVARDKPSGASPKMRRRDAVAPCSRAATTASGEAISHACATSGTTMSRLNTPKAAATMWPDTRPRQPPRLAK